MRRRLWLLPIVLALACSPTAFPALEAQQPPAGELLYLQEAGKVRVRDAATGAIQAEAPNGLISPDWKTVYTLANVAHDSADVPEGRTPVLAMELFGETVRSIDLPGEYQIPAAVPGRPAGLSADGKTLVLHQPGTSSRFAVLDTSFDSPPHYVDLPGHFTLDALNPNGKSLYLIEHISEDGYAYRVRRYIMTTGALDPQPIVLKSANPHESMQGLPAAQVSSSNGAWVYTLYTNYQKGPFIHALQTNGNGIACINLGSDWRTTNDDEANLAWTMALSPDGATLYVANAALGAVASVDATQHFGVINRTKLPRPMAGWFSAPVAEAKPHVRGGMAPSPDGRILYAIAGKSVVALNPKDLSVHQTWLKDRWLTSIAVSPDGRRLYAAEDGGNVLRIDTSTGAITGEIEARAEEILRVL